MKPATRATQILLSTAAIAALGTVATRAATPAGTGGVGLAVAAPASVASVTQPSSDWGSGGATLPIAAAPATTAPATTTTSAATTTPAKTTVEPATVPPSSGGVTPGGQTAPVSSPTSSLSPTPPTELDDGGATISPSSADPRAYSVLWSCATSCRVATHDGPGERDRVISRIAGGDAVTVACQTVGSLVRAAGGRSRIWDKLIDGAWISDLFVTTPDHGTFSAGLPTCLAPAGATSVE